MKKDTCTCITNHLLNCWNKHYLKVLTDQATFC